MNQIILAIFLTFIGIMNVGANEINAEKTMIFDSHRSINEGCLLVERQMKKDAIEKQCGSDFQASSLRIKSNEEDSLTKLYLATLSGYVIGFNRTQTTLDASQNVDKFECTVRAKISVSCQNGVRDSGHQPIVATLNKMIYVEGDEVIIKVGPAHHDRYMSIVQIITRASGEKEVWRVFPNQYNKNQFIPKGMAITFPSGYSLSTKIIDDLDISDENLMLITTKSPISEIKSKSSIEGFYRWLSEIKIEDRREIILPYRVINSKGEK